MITDRRAALIKRVVSKRQQDLTVILENVHDPHNIGAVLRTCDSIGIGEVYVILTEDGLNKERYIGKNSSTGAKKWVDVHFFNDVDTCFKEVRLNFEHIYGTHLNQDSVTLYDLDLSTSCALLFGNEHQGISEESLSLIDGNFIIPQVGMVQSLNISVACAVSLYEAFRQRNVKGLYDQPYNEKLDPYFDKYVNKTRGLI